MSIIKDFISPVLSHISDVYPCDGPDSFLRIILPLLQGREGVLLLSGTDIDCANYSIAGWDPLVIFSSVKNSCCLQVSGLCTRTEDDPLYMLQQLVDLVVGANKTRLPGGFFGGGFLGYFSYDLKGIIEDLPENTINDLKLPHMYWIIPAKVAVFDHRKGNIQFFQWVMPDSKNCVSLQSVPFWADSEMKGIKNRHTGPYRGSCFALGPVSVNFTKDAYVKTIEKVRRYIVQGDIYQANLTQRFEADFNGDPLSLFKALFERNPAPFYAYIHAADHHVLCTSMERFLLCDGQMIETRPIKGTRPRGKTPLEDMRLKEDLVNSPKDDAELSMIVDLLRNDLGKICVSGTVSVREHKRIETYQYVHHLVSIVEGRLLPGTGISDIVRATFPGGSITGCPKIRSMEIIDELEPCCRQVYTGSIGYIAMDGKFDLNIAIRTLIIKNNRGYYGAGGGIVYDSVPEKEYDETLYKARAFLVPLHEFVLDAKRPAVRK